MSLTDSIEKLSIEDGSKEEEKRDEKGWTMIDLSEVEVALQRTSLVAEEKENVNEWQILPAKVSYKEMLLKPKKPTDPLLSHPAAATLEQKTTKPKIVVVKKGETLVKNDWGELEIVNKRDLFDEEMVVEDEDFEIQNMYFDSVFRKLATGKRRFKCRQESAAAYLKKKTA